MDSLHNAQKDIWDKLSASSGVIAAILVPIAVAFVGAQYSSALKQRELDVTSKRAYVEIALTILRDPNTNNSMRQWGTNIINYYSDVPMPDETQKAFIQQGQILPPAQQAAPNAATNSPPVTITGRVAQMDALQTTGINALLDRDWGATTQAYESAYNLWPTFRNVDEIRALLKSSSPPRTDQTWKNLYQKISKFDLRGVNQNTVYRLVKGSQ